MLKNLAIFMVWGEPVPNSRVSGHAPMHEDRSPGEARACPSLRRGRPAGRTVAVRRFLVPGLFFSGSTNRWGEREGVIFQPTNQSSRFFHALLLNLSDFLEISLRSR